MNAMPTTPTPVSSAQRKRARRTLLACVNCRRKKTRCPGERPRCSTCSRLGQTCRYPVDEAGEAAPVAHEGHRETPHAEDSGPSYIRRLEDRLARMEAKLEGKQDKAAAGRSASREETPQIRVVDGSGPPTVAAALPGQSRLPPTQVLEEAISVYFRCSHRQPVWLFEPRSALSTSSADAILFSVLAISSQHSPEAFAPFEHCPLKSPAAYNDAARSIILDRIARSDVDLATLQALCLLAFSNLVLGDLELASFHVGLVGSLMQCAGLDTHVAADRTPLLEGQRRLFWSVQMVAVLCGAPLKIASTYDIRAPYFLMPQETNIAWRRQQGTVLKTDAPLAPLLPLDPLSMSIRRTYSDRDGQHGQPRAVTSIWLHMVRSAGLWGLVRSYVWRCHAGNVAHAPWHPDADYTAIYAQLLDMEGVFPVTFRYDAARFMDRPLEDLAKQSDFWLPWMKIQVTYHTIHSVLNHPFLYSPRVAQPRPGGSNAFWKTSTDLALLHSTWIARILGMAQKKGLALADPFFVYAAAVAITLHLYWSRAADPSIRAAAEKYIDVCRTFIRDLATHWPVCRNIEHDVELLMNLSASSRPQPQEAGGAAAAADQPVPSTTLADTISLIWRILDFAAFQQPNAPTGQSMFNPSFRASLRARATSPDQMDLEDPQVESPPKDFQTSLGDYAAPPDWFSPPDDPSTEGAATAPAAADTRPGAQETSQMPIMVPPTTTGQVDVPVGHAIDDLSSWTAWEAQPTDAASAVIFDPFGQLFLSRNAPDYSRWWDGGHL